MRYLITLALVAMLALFSGCGGDGDTIVNVPQSFIDALLEDNERLSNELAECQEHPGRGHGRGGDGEDDQGEDD